MARRDSDIARARFEALYGYASVRAHALRRADPDTAQEVVAETFLTAWRRLDDVPDPPLAWLYRPTPEARRASKVVTLDVCHAPRRANDGEQGYSADSLQAP